MTALLAILVRALAALNGAVSVSARNIAAVLVAVMVTIVLVQIGLRAAVGETLPWAEEVTRILLVWSGFLVAPFAHRTAANVSIDMFAQALPDALRRALGLAIQLLVLVICVMFLRESLAFVTRGMKIDAATLPIKMGYAYLAAPIGFAALALVSVELVLRGVLSWVDRTQDWTLRPAQAVTAPE